MAKYAYLKLKYIIPTILIIILVTLLGVFFLGGLKKKTLAFDNEEFDVEGFRDFSILTKEEEHALKKNVLIGHNST